MAGFRPSFESNVDFAYGQRAVMGRQMDIAGGIQRGLSGMGNVAKGIADAREKSRGLARDIHDAAEEQDRLVKILLKTKEGTKEFEELSKRIQHVAKEEENLHKNLKKTNAELKKMKLDTVNQGLDKLVKGLLKFNTSLLGLAFDFVIDGIKRVYELQERWTKAIGAFNIQMGGMTKGLAGLTKEAVRWSSTMRGLTNGDIAEGIQMFGEFATALGQVKKAMDFGAWGLQVSRGFNLGNAGAAKMAATLDSMGDSTQEMTKFMGADLIKAANAADVPVNVLAKDLSESTSYMARFGKENQRMFVQGSAYAHKFYLSIKDVQRSVEGLDMFDDAAKTASKLNTVFGTMINSMDLMMEDDPAKRIEMIRQQFLALGKTEDRLSPKEIRYLSETMHLTEEQTRALLSQKNANVSYADFQKKAMAQDKEEANAKRNMELMLRKTAQTLFAFGAAFDKVTLAIANAIKPMLVVLGLARDNDKQFKSFGEVMKGITDTVVEFFNSLAKDPRWKDFMQTLADDMLSAGHALKEFVLSGNAARMVGDMAAAMKNFYTWVRDLAKDAVPYLKPLVSAFMFLAQHIDRIAMAWGAIRGAGALKGFLGNALGGGGGAIGKAFGARGVASRAIGGAGLGLAAGAALGGTGAMIGGGIGGAVGAFIPIIGPFMGPIGAALGKGIEELFKSEGEKDLERAIQDRKDAEERVAKTQDLIDAMDRRNSLRKKQLDDRNARTDDILLRAKKDSVRVTGDDRRAVLDRIQTLTHFGLKMKVAAAVMKDLENGTRPTAAQMDAISKAQASYTKTLSDVDDATQKVLANEQLKAKQADFERKAAEARVEAGQLDLEIQDLEKQRKDAAEKAGKMSAGDYGLSVFGVGTAKKQIDIAKATAALDKELEEKRTQREKAMKSVADQQLNVQKEMVNQMRRVAITTTPEYQAYAIQQRQAKKAIDLAGFLKGNIDALASETGESREDLLAAVGARMPIAAGRGMASGGIVTRPIRATIGEAGPEAVIPLRAMARGRMRQPQKFGGSAAHGLVAGGGGGDRVVVVSTDVHLDSQKVGRALVRAHITGRD